MDNIIYKISCTN